MRLWLPRVWLIRKNTSEATLYPNISQLLVSNLVSVLARFAKLYKPVKKAQPMTTFSATPFSNLTVLCGTGAGVLMVAVQVLGGILDPNYSHTYQYISELGAMSAPTQHWVNYAGFLPIGFLVLIFTAGGFRLVANSTASKIGWVLFGGVGLAYVIAGFAPCDPGCPAEGSARQAIHNLGGLFEYVGGAIGVMLAANSLTRLTRLRRVRLVSYAVATLTLLAFTVLLLGVSDMVGAWQRLAEFSLFGWVAWVCVGLRLSHQA